MRNAQLEALKNGIDIKLYAVNYPEDDSIIPNYFIKLPHLTKSTLTEFPDIAENRKLPIVQEMFDLVINNSDADYIIFTNTDIGVKLNFYKEIHEIIKRDNLKAFIINRRDNIPKFKNNIRLTEDHLDMIYQEKGEDRSRLHLRKFNFRFALLVFKLYFIISTFSLFLIVSIIFITFNR